MNKSAIQRYAIWARTEMKGQVKQRAYQYGITEDGYGEANAITIGGRALSPVEQTQRKELVAQIQRKGYEQVMEEVAYTWFNRFIALRYMEVNNFLPSHIRVFSDITGAFKPEILNDALHLDIPGLDAAKVAELIESNQTENLYRYLLLTQCNALNEALPRMFERMGGYTELLLPNNILKQDGILGRMIAEIPEEDWTDQVQIIGWLYQYYNSEYKDETFALLKKNVKITKERIPSATQLFTPDWIVRYMVENSLGRIFIDKRKNEGLFADGRGAAEMTWDEIEKKRISNEEFIAEQMGWKYYLPEAAQTREVRAQLDKIQTENNALDVKSIKVIDPCMGSGHILVYAFDILIQIYKEYGVSERDAAQSILQNNLYGLDIDDRAAQLAYFAVMMKARQYDRRIFSRGIQPNLYSIMESNGIDTNAIDYFTDNNPKLKKELNTLVHELWDAKEYGSILNISAVDFATLYDRIREVRDDISMFRETILNDLTLLIHIAEIMSQKYDVVVTNPPYMGSSGMSGKLNDYVKETYPDSKSDLSTVFMEKTLAMCNPTGFMAMINIPVWMFISSYEKLRLSLINSRRIISLVHPGRGIFGSDFGTTTFVISKKSIKNYIGTYQRLFIRQGDVETPEVREQAFLAKTGLNYATQDVFLKIPGQPIAYWLKNMSIFDYPCLGESIDARIGMVSGDNDRFLRFWHEVLRTNIEFDAKPMNDPMKKTWYPLQKGGDFRKWYGNITYVVNWANDGYSMKYDNYMGSRVRSHNYNGTQQFKEGITWNSISASKFHCRYSPIGFTYDAAGPLCEVKSRDYLWTVLGFLSTKVAEYIFSVINPTINFPSGYLESLPFKVNRKEKVDSLAQQCVDEAKREWDSFETSWDFSRHPLLAVISKNKILFDDISSIDLAECYMCWERECSERFVQIKTNEEELNRIFIDIYGLQKEITPEVEDKDVTVRLADRKRDITSLISYAVGCMFGRYSINAPGLIYAGGNFGECYRKDRLGDGNGFGITFGGTGISTSKEYSSINIDGKWYETSFPPVADNIIPICDDDYFDNDITGRFVKWVETVYGTRSLESNLKFIADALCGKGTPREVIRNYFINDFYADHLKIYQKRPIYWLFDSGKKNGFKALIYMHRYESDLLAKMRTDYVHEQQERYRTQLTHLADAISHASAPERVKLTKQQKKIQDQSLEIQKYEEKIHHLADMNIPIDLDDGVKHNYSLFADVLAKIK